MQILIVTPAPKHSLKGNRITAIRWAKILRSLGHRVRVAEKFQSQRCDLMIALHARRSAISISRFRSTYSTAPLLVALTGTDLYQDLQHSAAARRSLELADFLILLQSDGIRFLPKAVRAKARVILQSVVAPTNLPKPLTEIFEVVVSGHLRPVKDPFRTAMAARRLPAESRIRVVHLGAALTEATRHRAAREHLINPRYQWLGEKSHAQAMRRLGRSRLLVVSSKLEGGANVVSEAISMNVPVLSSRISGSIGLLGDDYPGYFEVGDTRELASLLYRAETDLPFYQNLVALCEKRAKLFAPATEQKAWAQLLSELDL